MIEKSFGLFFFLKKGKNAKGDERHVYLKITVDGTAAEIATKRMWHPDRWIQKAGRASGSKEDAKVLNNYLDLLTNKVYEAKKILVDTAKPVSAQAIKNIVTGNTDSKKTIMQIFAQHNYQMKALIGQDFAKGTYDRYKTSYDHTKAFITWKYGKEDLQLSALNYDFISDYYFWLKTVRKCAHNTTVKYLRNFKKIVLTCVKKGWLPRDPFLEFKKSIKDVERFPLDKEELDRLASRVFSSDRLNAVRDIFLFCCYTGLAYLDIKNLLYKQIEVGIDGEQWIITHRQKTSTPTRIPLLPFALSLLEKYEHHPKRIIEGYALPVYSNQKVNDYLKEIASICEIKKELTFHIARHSFATTVTLTNGVPIETVSKMLGHKSIRQTQHYAKTIDWKVSEDMQNLKVKLG